MSLSERIPGMKPGHTTRNVALGVVYLLVISGALGASEDPDAGGPGNPNATADADTDSLEEAGSESESTSESDSDLPPSIKMAFMQTVEEEGVTVENVEMQGNEFVVDYVRSGTTETAFAADSGTLAGAYAGMLSEGHGGERLVVNVYTRDGRYFGRYRIQAQWATEWANGEISNAEMYDRISSTTQRASDA